MRLNVLGSDAVRAAAVELLAAARPEDGATGVLVAPMVQGARELIAGLVLDPQFGRTVMLGVGGVLAEAVADVVFRLVPITSLDAAEMIEDLATQKLLGAFRASLRSIGRRWRPCCSGSPRWPRPGPTWCRWT